MFGVPFGTVALVAWLMGRHKRKLQEQKYAPFYQQVETFAQSHGYSAKRVPLFGAQAQQAIRQFLPRDLPGHGKPPSVIPLYNDREEHYGSYRSAYSLEKERSRILWIPKYARSRTELYGVILHLSPMPPTRHWMTLRQEKLFDFSKDQELESRHFNEVFALHSSSPKLSTEVFTPDLMDRLLAQRHIRTYIRLRGSTAIVGQEAVLSNDRLQTVVGIAEDVCRRFVRAYPSHAEPNE